MHSKSSWRAAMGAMIALALCGAAAAQLLPPVSAPSLPPTPNLGGTLGTVGQTGASALGRANDLTGSASGLADARVARLDALVRANRDTLEMTDLGPAVRGEVIAVDPDPAVIAAALQAGFTRLG